jgi:hypothetical protein
LDKRNNKHAIYGQNSYTWSILVFNWYFMLRILEDLATCATRILIVILAILSYRSIESMFSLGSPSFEPRGRTGRYIQAHAGYKQRVLVHIHSSIRIIL